MIVFTKYNYNSDNINNNKLICITIIIIIIIITTIIISSNINTTIIIFVIFKIFWEQYIFLSMHSYNHNKYGYEYYTDFY